MTLSILVIAAGLCLLLSLYLSLAPIWAMDQGAKLIQIESVKYQRFAGIAIPYPGASLDPSGELSPVPALFTVERGEDHVSRFPYAYAFVCAALSAVAGDWGPFLPSIGATLGVLVLCFRLGRSVGVRRPGFLPWVVVAASPVLFYALVVWEHQLAALAATFCLVLGAEGRRTFLAGCVAGLAFLLRPEAVLFGLAFCLGTTIAASDRRRAAVSVSTGWLLGLMPAVLSNLAVYGRPLGADVQLHYADPLTSPVRLLARVIDRPEVAVGLVFDVAASVGWLFALAGLAAAPRFFAGRWRPLPVLLLALVTVGFVVSRGGSLHHPGLIASCPLLLLLLGPDPPRAGRAGRLLRVTCAAYFGAVLLTAPDAGMSQWGPRFLLPILPCLVVLAWRRAEGLLAAARAPGRAVVATGLGLILAASLVLQVRGLGVLRYRTSHWQEVADVVAQLGHRVVAADYWSTPLKLAPLYFEREVLLIEGEHELEAVRRTLRANGLDGFVLVASQEWSRDPARLAVAGFTCRPAASFHGRPRVLDCRVDPEV